MTSVPSHRLPLNGNKLALVLALAIAFFSSCELFKPVAQNNSDNAGKNGTELDPVQGRRVYDPATGTYVIVKNAPTEKMDTIRWREIPSSEEPPIYSTSAPVTGNNNNNPVKPIGEGEGGSQLLSSYNVAVILPFLTDKFDPTTRRFTGSSEWSLQFYAGMRLALDELNDSGVKLNVSILDSKASEQHVAGLTRTDPNLRSAHLIFGPYLRNNAALVADMAKTTGGVVVSPFTTSSTVTDRNNNYIQVNPTLETHCQNQLQHAMQTYNFNEIALVATNRPEEAERFAYFNREYARMQGNANAPKIKQLVLDTAQINVNASQITSLMAGQDRMAFMVPTWANEEQIYSLLRAIDAARGSRTVAVYSLPQWMNFDRINFDFYEKLNLHISASSFVDNSSAEVKQFSTRFLDRYGTLPNDEALAGYDLTRFFVKQLTTHGTRFQNKMNGNTVRALGTSFKFEPVYLPTANGAERPVVSRWENKFLNIVAFKDYRFGRVN